MSTTSVPSQHVPSLPAQALGERRGRPRRVPQASRRWQSRRPRRAAYGDALPALRRVRSGHGIGVHATLGDGWRVAGDALAGEINGDPEPRAIRIETVVVPTYEVPRTAPPTEADAGENPAFGKLAGLVLDMKVLAESDAKKLPKQLEPLLAAYRDWIDREHAKLSDPREGLAQFGDAGPVAIANCRRTLQRIEEGLALISKDASACQAFLFMNRSMWPQRPWRSRQARPTHRRGTDPRHGFERPCYRHRSLRDTRCGPRNLAAASVACRSTDGMPAAAPLRRFHGNFIKR